MESAHWSAASEAVTLECSHLNPSSPGTLTFIHGFPIDHQGLSLSNKNLSLDGFLGADKTQHIHPRREADSGSQFRLFFPLPLH
jgi:hypothetical protein